MPRPGPTVALRLTLWYAAAFTLSSLLAMAIIYVSVAGALREKTDAELRQDLEETAALILGGGPDAFREELAREMAGSDSTSVFLRLWSGDGAAVASAGFEDADSAVRRIVLEQRTRSEPSLHSIRMEDHEFGVRVGYAMAGPGFVVEFGQPLEEVEELLGALRIGIAIALPTVLLLGGPIGWFVARRALRGVAQVTGTALEIADGALERRVPVGAHDDELTRLAAAFNQMLDRIEALIDGMREVTDNLAHDLRTPLARIRASAERAAVRGATAEEWAALAATTTEECDRVLGILNSTLEIAEAQAGAAQLRIEEVDLVELAGEGRDLFATLAEDAGVALSLQASGRCVTRADRGRVQRIVANLLDNALKFTARGGRVEVVLAEEGSWVRLDVRDTGAGISAAELPRIFERFYRGDGSRTGRGSGLGLSLARAFARAHGGDLTAVSTPGAGSVFTLRLRRAGDSEDQKVRNSPDERV